MSLRIEAPNLLYTAGQHVAGQVILSGGQNVDIQLIKIILEGQCKTKSVGPSRSNSTTTYRGLITLFMMETVLFTGPYLLKADGRWTFQFTIPTSCNVHRPGDPMTMPNANFNVDPHQPLPPQFDSDGFRQGGLTTLPMIPNSPNHRGDGTSRNKAALVQYILKAQLISSKTKLFSSGIVETVAPLRFSTMRNIDLPNLQWGVYNERIICKSMHLMTGFEDRKLTLREKLSSMQSENLPTTAFDVVAKIPKLVVIGKALPIFLSIQHIPASSTFPDPPTVYLHGFETTIVALTNFRTEHRGTRSQNPRQDIVNGRFTVARREWPEPGVTIQGDMDMQKVVDLTIYEALSRPPTFWTYNISRGYTLSVKVDIECAKKKFHVKFTVPTFDLLPSVYQPSPPFSDEPPPKILDEGPAPLFQAVAPPAYNSAESSSYAQALQR